MQCLEAPGVHAQVRVAEAGHRPCLQLLPFLIGIELEIVDKAEQATAAGGVQVGVAPLHNGRAQWAGEGHGLSWPW